MSTGISAELLNLHHISAFKHQPSDAAAKGIDVGDSGGGATKASVLRVIAKFGADTFTVDIPHTAADREALLTVYRENTPSALSMMVSKDSAGYVYDGALQPLRLEITAAIDEEKKKKSDNKATASTQPPPAAHSAGGTANTTAKAAAPAASSSSSSSAASLSNLVSTHIVSLGLVATNNNATSSSSSSKEEEEVKEASLADLTAIYETLTGVPSAQLRLMFSGPCAHLNKIGKGHKNEAKTDTPPPPPADLNTMLLLKEKVGSIVPLSFLPPSSSASSATPAISTKPNVMLLGQPVRLGIVEEAVRLMLTTTTTTTTATTPSSSGANTAAGTAAVKLVTTAAGTAKGGNDASNSNSTAAQMLPPASPAIQPLQPPPSSSSAFTMLSNGRGGFVRVAGEEGELGDGSSWRRSTSNGAASASTSMSMPPAHALRELTMERGVVSKSTAADAAQPSSLPPSPSFAPSAAAAASQQLPPLTAATTTASAPSSVAPATTTISQRSGNALLTDDALVEMLVTKQNEAWARQILINTNDKLRDKLLGIDLQSYVGDDDNDGNNEGTPGASLAADNKKHAANKRRIQQQDQQSAGDASHPPPPPPNPIELLIEGGRKDDPIATRDPITGRIVMKRRAETVQSDILREQIGVAKSIAVASLPSNVARPTGATNPLSSSPSKFQRAKHIALVVSRERQLTDEEVYWAAKYWATVQSESYLGFRRAKKELDMCHRLIVLDPFANVFPLHQMEETDEENNNRGSTSSPSSSYNASEIVTKLFPTIAAEEIFLRTSGTFSRTFWGYLIAEAAMGGAWAALHQLEIECKREIQSVLDEYNNDVEPSGKLISDIVPKMRLTAKDKAAIAKNDVVAAEIQRRVAPILDQYIRVRNADQTRAAMADGLQQQHSTTVGNKKNKAAQFNKIAKREMFKILKLFGRSAAVAARANYDTDQAMEGEGADEEEEEEEEEEMVEEEEVEEGVKSGGRKGSAGKRKAPMPKPTKIKFYASDDDHDDANAPHEKDDHQNLDNDDEEYEEEEFEEDFFEGDDDGYEFEEDDEDDGEETFEEKIRRRRGPSYRDMLSTANHNYASMREGEAMKPQQGLTAVTTVVGLAGEGVLTEDFNSTRSKVGTNYKPIYLEEGNRTQVNSASKDAVNKSKDGNENADNDADSNTNKRSDDRSRGGGGGIENWRVPLLLTCAFSLPSHAPRFSATCLTCVERGLVDSSTSSTASSDHHDPSSHASFAHRICAVCALTCHAGHKLVWREATAEGGRPREIVNPNLGGVSGGDGGGVSSSYEYRSSTININNSGAPLTAPFVCDCPTDCFKAFGFAKKKKLAKGETNAIECSAAIAAETDDAAEHGDADNTDAKEEIKSARTHYTHTCRYVVPKKNKKQQQTDPSSLPSTVAAAAAQMTRYPRDLANRYPARRQLEERKAKMLNELLVCEEQQFPQQNPSVEMEALAAAKALTASCYCHQTECSTATTTPATTAADALRRRVPMQFHEYHTFTGIHAVVEASTVTPLLPSVDSVVDRIEQLTNGKLVRSSLLPPPTTGLPPDGDAPSASTEVGVADGCGDATGKKTSRAVSKKKAATDNTKRDTATVQCDGDDAANDATTTTTAMTATTPSNAHLHPPTSTPIRVVTTSNIPKATCCAGCNDVFFEDHLSALDARHLKSMGCHGRLENNKHAVAFRCRTCVYVPASGSKAHYRDKLYKAVEKAKEERRTAREEARRATLLSSSASVGRGGGRGARASSTNAALAATKKKVTQQRSQSAVVTPTTSTQKTPFSFTPLPPPPLFPPGALLLPKTITDSLKKGLLVCAPCAFRCHIANGHDVDLSTAYVYRSYGATALLQKGVGGGADVGTVPSVGTEETRKKQNATAAAAAGTATSATTTSNANTNNNDDTFARYAEAELEKVSAVEMDKGAPHPHHISGPPTHSRVPPSCRLASSGLTLGLEGVEVNGEHHAASQAFAAAAYCASAVLGYARVEADARRDTKEEGRKEQEQAHADSIDPNTSSDAKSDAAKAPKSNTRILSPDATPQEAAKLLVGRAVTFEDVQQSDEAAASARNNRNKSNGSRFLTTPNETIFFGKSMAEGEMYIQLLLKEQQAAGEAYLKAEKAKAATKEAKSSSGSAKKSASPSPSSSNPLKANGIVHFSNSHILEPYKPDTSAAALTRISTFDSARPFVDPNTLISRLGVPEGAAEKIAGPNSGSDSDDDDDSSDDSTSEDDDDDDDEYPTSFSKGKASRGRRGGRGGGLSSRGGGGATPSSSSSSLQQVPTFKDTAAYCAYRQFKKEERNQKKFNLQHLHKQKRGKKSGGSMWEDGYIQSFISEGSAEDEDLTNLEFLLDDTLAMIRDAAKEAKRKAKEEAKKNKLQRATEKTLAKKKKKSVMDIDSEEDADDDEDNDPSLPSAYIRVVDGAHLMTAQNIVFAQAAKEGFVARRVAARIRYLSQYQQARNIHSSVGGSSNNNNATGGNAPSAFSSSSARSQPTHTRADFIQLLMKGSPSPDGETLHFSNMDDIQKLSQILSETPVPDSMLDCPRQREMAEIRSQVLNLLNKRNAEKQKKTGAQSAVNYALTGMAPVPLPLSAAETVLSHLDETNDGDTNDNDASSKKATSTPSTIPLDDLSLPYLCPGVLTGNNEEFGDDYWTNFDGSSVGYQCGCQSSMLLEHFSRDQKLLQRVTIMVGNNNTSTATTATPFSNAFAPCRIGLVTAPSFGDTASMPSSPTFGPSNGGGGGGFSAAPSSASFSSGPIPIAELDASTAAEELLSMFATACAVPPPVGFGEGAAAASSSSGGLANQFVIDMTPANGRVTFESRAALQDAIMLSLLVLPDNDIRYLEKLIKNDEEIAGGDISGVASTLLCKILGVGLGGATALPSASSHHHAKSQRHLYGPFPVPEHRYEDLWVADNRVTVKRAHSLNCDDGALVADATASTSSSSLPSSSTAINTVFTNAQLRVLLSHDHQFRLLCNWCIEAYQPWILDYKLSDCHVMKAVLAGYRNNNNNNHSGGEKEKKRFSWPACCGSSVIVSTASPPSSAGVALSQRSYRGANANDSPPSSDYFYPFHGMVVPANLFSDRYVCSPATCSGRGITLLHRMALAPDGSSTYFSAETVVLGKRKKRLAAAAAASAASSGGGEGGGVGSRLNTPYHYEKKIHSGGGGGKKGGEVDDDDDNAEDDDDDDDDVTAGFAHTMGRDMSTATTTAPTYCQSLFDYIAPDRNGTLDAVFTTTASAMITASSHGQRVDERREQEMSRIEKQLRLSSGCGYMLRSKGRAVLSGDEEYRKALGDMSSSGLSPNADDDEDNDDNDHEEVDDDGKHKEKNTKKLSKKKKSSAAAADDDHHKASSSPLSSLLQVGAGRDGLSAASHYNDRGYLVGEEDLIARRGGAGSISGMLGDALFGGGGGGTPESRIASRFSGSHKGGGGVPSKHSSEAAHHHHRHTSASGNGSLRSGAAVSTFRHHHTLEEAFMVTRYIPSLECRNCCCSVPMSKAYGCVFCLLPQIMKMVAVKKLAEMTATWHKSVTAELQVASKRLSAAKADFEKATAGGDEDKAEEGSSAISTPTSLFGSKRQRDAEKDDEGEGKEGGGGVSKQTAAINSSDQPLSSSSPRLQLNLGSRDADGIIYGEDGEALDEVDLEDEEFSENEIDSDVEEGNESSAVISADSGGGQDGKSTAAVATEAAKSEEEQPATKKIRSEAIGNLGTALSTLSAPPAQSSAEAARGAAAVAKANAALTAANAQLGAIRQRLHLPSIRQVSDSLTAEDVIHFLKTEATGPNNGKLAMLMMVDGLAGGGGGGDGGSSSSTTPFCSACAALPFHEREVHNDVQHPFFPILQCQQIIALRDAMASDFMRRTFMAPPAAASKPKATAAGASGDGASSAAQPFSSVAPSATMFSNLAASPVVSNADALPMPTTVANVTTTATAAVAERQEKEEKTEGPALSTNALPAAAPTPAGAKPTQSPKIFFGAKRDRDEDGHEVGRDGKPSPSFGVASGTTRAHPNNVTSPTTANAAVPPQSSSLTLSTSSIPAGGGVAGGAAAASSAATTATATATATATVDGALLPSVRAPVPLNVEAAANERRRMINNNNGAAAGRGGGGGGADPFFGQATAPALDPNSATAQWIAAVEGRAVNGDDGYDGNDAVKRTKAPTVDQILLETVEKDVTMLPTAEELTIAPHSSLPTPFALPSSSSAAAVPVAGSSGSSTSAMTVTQRTLNSLRAFHRTCRVILPYNSSSSSPSKKDDEKKEGK